MGKLGLKLVFCENHSSYTHAFLKFFFSMLWGEVASNSIDFQKFIFLQFWSIKAVFRSIKIAFKNFSEPLSGSIDWTCFSINRTSWIKFFLNTVFDSFKTLFQTFLSLSDLARLHWGFFVIFNQILCKVFLSQGR